MSTATQTSAKDELLRLIGAAATGRLSAGAGAAEVAVFVLDGHVVAARAADDTSSLVDRLHGGGHLSDDRAAALRQMQQMSANILGREAIDPILRVLCEETDDAVLVEVLATRFDENLARFVGARGQVSFEEGAPPWAVNIQIGHDSRQRVEQAHILWTLAHTVAPDLVVTSGNAPGGDPFATQVMQAAGAGTPVVEVARHLELPDLVARAMIARALQEGVLVEKEDDDVEDEADEHSMEELEAFSGMGDHHRGGQREGGRFVTELHNLDRVELVDLDDDSPKSFSAPTLSDDESKAKIKVANDVLKALVTAVDAEKGEGQGKLSIQLLVDGRPRDFVALFDGVKVTRTGVLPTKALQTNLKQRPEPEQRRLLNRGLLDLLDRALDKVADEIEEDAFDEVLGNVMGYRQRMGL